MTEENGARVSSGEATAPPNDVSQTRQRKKRKWDQPAEPLLSAGVAVPGLLPFRNAGVIGSVPLPGVVPVSGVNLLTASGATATPLLQALSVSQQAALPSKVNQPKIQDELIIAREIVINDAEASLRYKLTKRQTQEEIQKCTGAVVITRGKYRPPNAPPSGEKPLHLHISAASHLKETAERILAVDHAAAMVEEMMKQTPNSQAGTFGPQPVNALKPLSTCVFLGFEADPSLNVAARIRGPNDQYINHIMNETGATAVLKGRGSGNLESQHGEEAQQPLHLFLSSANPKSLENAKRLAENLLDTISLEFGASRVSSHKVYGAVPPPQQLLTGAQGSEKHEQNIDLNSTSGLVSLLPNIASPCPVSSFSVPPTTYVYPQPQPKAASYPQPLSSGGTSYSGYADIYPQVTPLQQVALALRQSTSPVISTVSPSTFAATKASMISQSSEKEMQPPQKRKFKELPIASKGPAKMDQVLKPLRPGEAATDLGTRNTSNMPAPKKLVQPSSNGVPPSAPKLMPPPPPTPSNSIPPPPPRTMSPPPSRIMPPPPPKFTSSALSLKLHDNKNSPDKSRPDVVSDTLVKLMEYGENDDDDLDETTEKSSTTNSDGASARKPFWAV